MHTHTHRIACLLRTMEARRLDPEEYLVRVWEWRNADTGKVWDRVFE